MSKREEFEPWKENPDIWETEGKFWAWLRGGLRRGLWEKSPIKLSFKNSEVSPPPEGLKTRAKSGAECALTGEWTGKSKLEVDHQIGHKSLKSVDDILDFVLHLIPSKEDLQLVSKEAHKIKSYAERMDISFEDAVAEKRAINKMKQKVDKQKKELLSLGFTEDEVGNATNRRACYVKYFKEN